MNPKSHPSKLGWRPPKSDWRSSPLSPNDGGLKQRWHKQYGRLGRCYETRTPQGPSAIEFYGPWEGEYRKSLSKQTLERPRELANRAIPVFDFGQSSSQEIHPGDKFIDVEEFLGKLPRPWPQNDGAGSCFDGAASASGSAEAGEEDKLEDARPRYTAAEKGKQREGEPVPSIAKGPSALKPAVPDNLQTLAPETPTQGLRLPPRRPSAGDEKDEETPGVQRIEHAGDRSTKEVRVSFARSFPATFLKKARQEIKFAAELPLDGLGVVHDTTLILRPPLEGREYPSLTMMESTWRQIGVPGPSSRAESAMMERTPSLAGALGHSSQEYLDLVAMSNQRLQELSPYSPEDRVPETPMPYLKLEYVDEESPPPPPSPSTESDDPSDGDGPRLGISEPYRAPALPKKRDASKISGGCIPGPSEHRQPPTPAGPSAIVAPLSMKGHERSISRGELRAIDLQPPPPVQNELCRLYSVLVQVVQFAADDFIVVEPHDFIEVLSWSGSDEAGGAKVIQRVREQATQPNIIHRKLLVPFSVTVDMFLAVIDLGGTAFQVLHQRPEEDLQSRESDESDDGFETTMSVYDFICTLFPDQCPRYGAWNISFERTVQGPVVINNPGIVSGSYMNEIAGLIQLRFILPFFFEVLRIVCGVATRKAVDDHALLTRLFAIFEDPPCLKLSRVIEDLRKSSQAELTRYLEGQVQQVLEHREEEFKSMIAGMEPHSQGSHAPRELTYLRLRAKNDVSNAVTRSYNTTIDLMAQYAQIRFLLEAMASRGIMAKSFLHHELVNHMARRSFYLVNARKDILEPEAALNQFKFQGLNDFAQKIQKMKDELDHWLGMIHKHLNSAVIK